MTRILSPREMARSGRYGDGDMFAMFINEGMGRASDDVLMARLHGWPERIADVARAEIARRARLEADS